MLPKYIEIIEDNSYKFYFQYIWILIKSFQPSWIYSLSLAKFFGGKKTHVYKVIWTESGVSQCIGGFTLSCIPTIRYTPQNIINTNFIASAKQLSKEEYIYFSHIILLPKFRNKDIGSYLMQTFFIETKKKIWFVPVQKAQAFYIRLGSRRFGREKDNIFTLN